MCVWGGGGGACRLPCAATHSSATSAPCACCCIPFFCRRAGRRPHGSSLSLVPATCVVAAAERHRRWRTLLLSELCVVAVPLTHNIRGQPPLCIHRNHAVLDVACTSATRCITNNWAWKTLCNYSRNKYLSDSVSDKPT